MSHRPVLAIIPARGGSRGLPGKNVRSFAGKPLLAHSIAFAKLCPSVDRCIVSTDSEEIAAIAREHGGDVPFLRPAELASDTTPTMPVLKHALVAVEKAEARTYASVLLLEPTSPGRLLEDVVRAEALLSSDVDAAGVIAVSRPTFNPFWVGVVEGQQHAISPAFDTKKVYTRRQDVPPFFRINGSLYLWRREYVLDHDGPWYERRHLGLEIPEERAFSIDDLYEFQVAELLVTSGVIDIPWMKGPAR
jgi:N-acylneuraminate cytidylyltransferase